MKYIYIFEPSLQKYLIRRLIFMVFPFAAILIFSNLYAIHVTRNQVAESLRVSAQLHRDTIETEMRNLSLYLSNISENEPNALIFSGNESKDARHLAKTLLAYKLRKDSVIYTSSGNFFICDLKENSFTQVKNGFLKAAVYESGEPLIRAAFENAMKNPEGMKGFHIKDNTWYVLQDDSRHYLLRYIVNGNLCLGVWLHVDTLLEKLNINRYNDRSVSVVIAKGQNIARQALPFEKQIELPPADKYALFALDQKYLGVSEPFTIGAFDLLVLIPDSSILERLPLIMGITIAFILLFIVLLPFMYLTLQKILLNPLKIIGAAMTQLQSGDMSARIATLNRFHEFQVIHDTFNHMSEEITNLKIEVYEERISKQKTELDFLKLQIKPHFLLNSLNMIMAFAKTKNWGLIQEFTLSLAGYFRYLYQSDGGLMLIAEELNNVKDYLHIQSARFPDRFEFELDCDEGLFQYRIPTLLIQTFVENSIKYADESTNMRLCLRLMEFGADCIQIEVSDTGTGFPDAVLQTLQKKEPVIKSDGTHIGIWNAMRRLELLYGDLGYIHIENTVPFGSKVTITIPKKA